MNKTNAISIVLLCAAFFCTAQTGNLLKDIAFVTQIYGYYEAADNHTVFFVRDDNALELWNTNGTPNGTTQIKTYPTYFENFGGYYQPNPSSFNGQVFFTGYDETHGYQLHVTDGTTDGTGFFKDLTANDDNSGISLYNYNFNGFFAMNCNNQIWQSDGTPAGTLPISSSNSISGGMQTSGNYLYYNTHDLNTGQVNGLYRTDGIAAPVLLSTTVMLTYKVIEYNNEEYFIGFDLNTSPQYGRMYKVNSDDDLIEVLTETDIYIASIDLIVYNDRIFFSGFESATGSELYSTNGTPGNFLLEADILSGETSGAPGNFIIANDNRLYFRGTSTEMNDGAYYMYDLDEEVKPITLDNYSVPSLNPMIEFDNKIYFLGVYDYDWYLYELTGGAVDPTLVFLDNFSTLTGNGDKVLFKANDKLFFSGLNGGNDPSYADPFVLNPSSVNLTWTGNVSTNWFTANNWQPHVVPTETSNVVVPSGLSNYPVINSGKAKCKKFNAEAGATLSMTGGTLNVSGTFDVAAADCLNLAGGTVKLQGGSVNGFPNLTTFNNLTLVSVNNEENSNRYITTTILTINGNLEMQGTLSGNLPGYPSLLMGEGSLLLLEKNLTLNQGFLGIPDLALPLEDNAEIPKVLINGEPSVAQQLRFKNQVAEFGNVSGIMADLVIVNTNTKLVNSGTSIFVLNLELVSADFDLRGNNFSTRGKINYSGSTGVVKNSGSFNTCQLEILNMLNYSTNTEKARLRCGRLGAVVLVGDLINGNPANDTLILETDLITNLFAIQGHVDMNGKNVTIGAANSATGELILTNNSDIGSQIASGTLKLSGNALCPQYELNTKSLNNLTVNSPAGAKITNTSGIAGIDVYGSIFLKNGDLDGTNEEIRLIRDASNGSPNVAKLIETAGNTHIGEGLSAISIDTTIHQALTNKDFGGLGFIVTTPEDWLNNIKVIRFSFPFVEGAINRSFYIINQNPGGNLNAQITIKYDESELNGIAEADLGIWRDAGFGWELLPSAVNINTNTVATTSSQFSIDGAAGSGTEYILAPINAARANTEVPETAVPGAAVNILQLKAYPNPFSDNFTIAFNASLKEAAQLTVTDISGRVYHVSTVQVAAGENNINVSCLDHAASGIYFVSLKSSSGNSTVKLMKID